MGLWEPFFSHPAQTKSTRYVKEGRRGWMRRGSGPSLSLVCGQGWRQVTKPPLYWRSPFHGGCANLLLIKKKLKITEQQLRQDTQGYINLNVMSEALLIIHRTFNCQHFRVIGINSLSIVIYHIKSEYVLNGYHSLSSVYINNLLYPFKVALETVDVKLGLLGIHIGTDGEKVLRAGQKAISQKTVTF